VQVKEQKISTCCFAG